MIWKKLLGLLFSAGVSVLFLLSVSAAEVTQELPVEKQVVGDTPSSPQTFTFQLEGKNSAPMPLSGDTLTITGGGKGSFEILYDTPGDYQYTLREIPGNAAGYTYDSTVYTITVQVVWDDTFPDQLVATVHAGKEGDSGKANQALFINRYTAPTWEEDSPGPTPTPKTTWLIPQTGDSLALQFWLLLALAALIAILFLFKTKRKGR